MAHGVLCKKCGFQETPHEFPDFLTDEDRSLVTEEYPVSLNKCDGYDPEDPEKSTGPQLTEVDMHRMERRAQGRAAWGMYGAYLRQKGFDKELAEKEKLVRKAGSSEERARLEGEKKKFVEDAKRSNGGVLYIG